MGLSAITSHGPRQARYGMKTKRDLQWRTGYGNPLRCENYE